MPGEREKQGIAFSHSVEILTSWRQREEFRVAFFSGAAKMISRFEHLSNLAISKNSCHRLMSKKVSKKFRLIAAFNRFNKKLTSIYIARECVFEHSSAMSS